TPLRPQSLLKCWDVSDEQLRQSLLPSPLAHRSEPNRPNCYTAACPRPRADREIFQRVPLPLESESSYQRRGAPRSGEWQVESLGFPRCFETVRTDRGMHAELAGLL